MDHDGRGGAATFSSRSSRSTAPIGLFHGDFQTSNLLFNEGVLEAVLDWEISASAATGSTSAGC